MLVIFRIIFRILHHVSVIIHFFFFGVSVFNFIIFEASVTDDPSCYREKLDI